jgi:hypothetical protein
MPQCYVIHTLPVLLSYVCENGFQDMNCADFELSQSGVVGKGKGFVQVSMIEGEESGDDVNHSMAVQCGDMARRHGSVGL